MDAKSNTLFCQSPVVTSRSESPAARHSYYLIVIRGGMPGTMLRLGSDETSLGRSTENTYALDDLTVSRRHATVRIDVGGLASVTDQGSTNGTFLNGNRLKAFRPVDIDDGDRLQLGSGVVLKLVRLDASDASFQRELFERTIRDGLTGVYNRAYFLDQVGALSARQEAAGSGLAILMIDIDHFKRVNDRYGHLVGDSVLREVSCVIREATRVEDLVARYGGEEFIVALPVGSAEMAASRAERIRVGVASRRIRAAGVDAVVTVSIGVAYGPSCWPVGEASLIEAADEALYLAKAEGRNCVILAGKPGSPSHETQSVEIITSL
ncbi:MAG: diguanylate cyclase [Isosphaeraceae bacterium]